MLKWIFLCFCCCFCQLLSGQEDKKIYHHEFGLNATLLFNQFTSFDNPSAGIYLINYKYIKNRNAFRFGSNIVDLNVLNPDPLLAFPTRLNGFNTNNRIGYQRIVPIYNKWQIFVGGDVLVSYSKFDLDASLLNTYSLGAGPVLGIQLMINKRISLFTESNFYLTYRKQTDRERTQFSSRLRTPVQLFLSFNL